MLPFHAGSLFQLGTFHPGGRKWNPATDAPVLSVAQLGLESDLSMNHPSHFSQVHTWTVHCGSERYCSLLSRKEQLQRARGRSVGVAEAPPKEDTQTTSLHPTPTFTPTPAFLSQSHSTSPSSYPSPTPSSSPLLAAQLIVLLFLKTIYLCICVCVRLHTHILRRQKTI